MIMEAQTSCPTTPQAGPFKCLPNGFNISSLSINGLSINGPEFGDNSNHYNNINAYSSSASISSASTSYSTPTSPAIGQYCHSPRLVQSPVYLETTPPSPVMSQRCPSPRLLQSPVFLETTPPSPAIGQHCHSPRPVQSPVFFQTTPPMDLNNGHPSCPRSPILPAAKISYTQASPHHAYSSQTSPHHVYTSQATPYHVHTSQHNMQASHHCPSAGQGWFPSNTIIINPAGATPGYGMCGGRITPAGCASPGRITPGRITPGRATPVYALAMKKRYVDIMLASTASTVAIDNKIEQAMDLVKSHLMFAVREEVDVLKERIGELMERINHLEYENTVLRKYATQEALQQIQQQHGGAPNP